MEWEMQDEVAEKPLDFEERPLKDNPVDVVMANVSFKLHLKE